MAEHEPVVKGLQVYLSVICRSAAPQLTPGAIYLIFELEAAVVYLCE